MDGISWWHWLICGFGRQVWAVNSAGRSASAWASGRTGPAPPEGVGSPIFLHVSATSAVVDIRPPARPNGIVSLYRVFSLKHNNHTLVKNRKILEWNHLTCMKVLVWFLWSLLLQSSIFSPIYSSLPYSLLYMFLNTVVTQKLNSPTLSPSWSFQREHPNNRHSMAYVLTPGTG